MNTIRITLGFLCWALLATASTDTNPTLSSYFIVPPNDAQMQKVADLFEVRHRKHNGFEVIVPAHRVAELRALIPDAKLLEYDISAFWKQFGPEGPRGYHNFQTVQEHLTRIATEYPELAQVTTYGKSQEGRPLLALKISDNVNWDEDEPELMLTSATHGDELITVEVLFGALDSLMDGYKANDARIRQIIQSTEMFFIPVVNPDGYVIKSRYSNGVDPNREYPWPEKPERNPNACIKNIIEFFHAHNFKGSMDIHSSGGMIMYPWAYTYDAIENSDQTIFHALTKQMASFNGYDFGPISKVIYVAKGSSADYYYWKNKTVATAIEVGSSSISGALSELKESIWAFIEHFKS